MIRYSDSFDPYLTPPEGDLTTGRGLLLLEFVRKWRREQSTNKLGGFLHELLHRSWTEGSR